MSLRGILQRRGDEWTSSLRGLDGIEAKPRFHNENVPVFKHHGTNLVIKKELRSDEAFLKDFTPFKGKKDAYYLKRLRKEWLDSNVDDSLTLEGFLASIGGYETAAEVYEAEEDLESSEDDEFPASVTLSFTDFQAKLEEERAAVTSMVGGGAATGEAESVWVEDEELEENQEELRIAVDTMKHYGLETKEDIAKFIGTFPGEYLASKEALLSTKQVVDGSARYNYNQKQAVLQVLRTRITVAKLLGDEKTVKTLKSDLHQIERMATTPHPTNPDVSAAWAKVKISMKDLKQVFKDWKASSRGKALIKSNTAAAAVAKLGGRTNINSVKELLADLNIHPKDVGYGAEEAE
jgi:hypothetical protein